MTMYLAIAANVVAILVLAFAVYFPRHRRRELVTAFLAVNAGVLAVSIALSNTEASIGLGLGLFGVLSIIRLRSSELSQREVAYYFSSLALGLLGGLTSVPLPLVVGLMSLIVVVMAIGDHPKLFRGYQNQTIVLDRAIADEAELRAYVEQVVGGPVHGLTVLRLDLIEDSTMVDARFRAVTRPAAPAAATAPATAAQVSPAPGAPTPVAPSPVALGPVAPGPVAPRPVAPVAVAQPAPVASAAIPSPHGPTGQNDGRQYSSAVAS